MSKETDAFQAGLVLYAPEDYDTPQAVDFFANSDTESLILAARWWTVNWNAPGNEGMIFYARRMLPGTGGGPPWMLQGGNETLNVAEDDWMQAALDRNRGESDFDRPAYLSALLSLKAQFPDFNFDDWIAAYRARPLRDAVVEAMKALTAPRQMAKVFIVDPSGRPVDVLVIDERGDAVTTGGDDWLDRAADDFTSQKAAPPPVADYINWLSGQTPYGGNALTGASSFTSGGLLVDVAANLMATRRA